MKSPTAQPHGRPDAYEDMGFNASSPEHSREDSDPVPYRTPIHHPHTCYGAGYWIKRLDIAPPQRKI